MYVLINGNKLFFDVDGTGLEPKGPEMKKKPTLFLLYGDP